MSETTAASRRSRRISGERQQTPEERGLTDADALLLRQITERPGAPVLLARAAWVLRQKHGSRLTDAQFEAKFFPPHRQSLASQSFQDILDLEVRDSQGGHAYRYIRQMRPQRGNITHIE